MGMFDNVKVDYPLPDTPRNIQKEIFQTKSFGDGFTGGFMDDYTITKDGELVLHASEYEMVPEEERPFYGTAEWDKHPLYQLMGCMKKISTEDKNIEFTGVLNFYTSAGTADSDTWYEYNMTFVNGKIKDVERVYREFGV